MTYKIPLKVLESHTAILGKAGAGKTVTAKGAAEMLLELGQRVCAIDPTGVWWGLKSSSNGKKAAFPLVIFGGEHADFPLTDKQGEAIAEIIGTTALSAIIDTRLLTVGQRTRFFTDFAQTLLRKNKGPLNVMIDEAHLFAPQGRVNDPQSGAMLSATNNLISLGRSAGLRVTMITQRPAKLHKDSLTQAETLIAMRLVAPQDRNAVKDWIGEQGDAGDGKDIIASLPSMPTGSGWIWAPEQGILERVKFPMIKTYDSSKAPSLDGGPALVLALPDTAAIEKKLGEIASDILTDDPKKLRAKIAELEQNIKTMPKGASREELKDAESKGYKYGFLDAWAECQNRAAELVAAVFKSFPTAPIGIEKITTADARPFLKNAMDAIKPKMEKKLQEVIGTHARQAISGTVMIADGEEKLGACAQKILNVLAQYPDGRTKKQLAILVEYSSKSSSYENSLGRLRTLGYVDKNPDSIKILDAGRMRAVVEILPRGKDLLAHWCSKKAIGKCERAILEYLYSSRGGETKDTLAEAVNYSPRSSSFENALGKLRSLELINRETPIKISEIFFE